jgi:Fe-S-cluster-containing hydrogenase component 2
MIAHYGYRDAEGAFYITLDTDRCVACEAKPCLAACPIAVLAAEDDPYGEGTVAAVAEGARRRIKVLCAPCKTGSARPSLPCVAACPLAAITHSW